MTEKREEKRHNRAVGVAEALSGALDPALKKRGFASLDLVTHWTSIAPEPYGQVSRPDRLVWPRGERGAEGAVLYLRCAPTHTLAVAHEGERIASAINRYFGFVLVGQVRLSTEPFEAALRHEGVKQAINDQAAREQVGVALKDVQDDALRSALQTLGLAIMSKKKS